MDFYYFSICHASLWDLGKEKDTIKPLSYITEAWSLNIILLKKWLSEMRTQTWFQNWREKGQKFKFWIANLLNLWLGSDGPFTIVLLLLTWAFFSNYNLLLEFLDDIKMCGIKKQYQAHCVTIVAKQCVPSGAWRIISWVKIVMSRLSRLLSLFWGKKASFCWVNRLSWIYHWTHLILLSNLKFLCFCLRNLSFKTDYY